MELNRMDSIIQNEFPTLIVPKYGELEPCRMLKTRLLMGEGGLYLETLQPWGRLVRNVWRSSRPLPYGKVEEVDTFVNVLLHDEVKKIIADEIICEAAKYAEDAEEWAGVITWNEKISYQFVPLAFVASVNEVIYVTATCGKATYPVVDVHSHGRIRPFFSPTDNEDDKGGVKIAVVLGNYHRCSNGDRSAPAFDVAVRYCVEGFHFVPQGGGEDAETDTE